jgi:glycosyltransferase involved in cell wall biosynthesis
MRISIITVNRNNKAGLEKTLESVLSQTRPPFEYIVIDGDSTDGSVALLERNSKSLTCWRSEKDSGIYEAMNKGIKAATGDYCIFLNSGDWLLSERVLETLDPLIDGDYDVYYSDHWVSDGAKKWKCHLPKSVDVNYFAFLSISHPNAVIRRQLLVDCGYYNEKFRISSDWLFFLDAIYTKKARFKYMETTIACFFHKGISGASGAADIISREKRDGVELVFKDLAPSINELNEYRESHYGYLVRNGADHKWLGFFLRVYRFAFIRFRRTFRRAA